LAPISRDLGIGSAQAIWLVAALYLASAIAQPTMGKLADRFGPKKVFLTGLVIVGVAGVVPEVLTGFGGAVFARVLIGIATAFIAANGRIGFGLDEFRAYAPETGGRFRYRWLAARRSRT
ncbi:MFS transporter, partial [Bacillus sp. S34]|nr:MFS transporter [Bacillus sp. S34]